LKLEDEGHAEGAAGLARSGDGQHRLELRRGHTVGTAAVAAYRPSQRHSVDPPDPWVDIWSRSVLPKTYNVIILSNQSITFLPLSLFCVLHVSTALISYLPHCSHCSFVRRLHLGILSRETHGHVIQTRSTTSIDDGDRQSRP
jgi:hypothetical protein